MRVKYDYHVLNYGNYYLLILLSSRTPTLAFMIGMCSSNITLHLSHTNTLNRNLQPLIVFPSSSNQ